MTAAMVNFFAHHYAIIRVDCLFSFPFESGAILALLASPL
jgi:hypothetical protein